MLDSERNLLAITNTQGVIKIRVTGCVWRTPAYLVHLKTPFHFVAPGTNSHHNRGPFVCILYIRFCLYMNNNAGHEAPKTYVK